MSWRNFRVTVFILLCGGTLLQTTTGCDTILAPVLSTLATTVISGLVSNLFLAT